jgi:hypothetical protein
MFLILPIRQTPSSSHFVALSGEWAKASAALFASGPSDKDRPLDWPQPKQSHDQIQNPSSFSLSPSPVPFNLPTTTETMGRSPMNHGGAEGLFAGVCAHITRGSIDLARLRWALGQGGCCCTTASRPPQRAGGDAAHGVLHGASSPQKAFDDLAWNNSAPRGRWGASSLSLSLERTNLINFYDMVLIEAGILI